MPVDFYTSPFAMGGANLKPARPVSAIFDEPVPRIKSRISASIIHLVQ